MTTCDQCSMCCKLFAFTVEGGGPYIKPVNEWCKLCKPGRGGCTIYNNRPPLCQSYACLWLQSQDGKGPPLAEELKPDRCKIIFDVNADQTLVVARLDPAYPRADEATAPQRFMQNLAKQGIPTYIICGDRRRIFGSTDPRLLDRIERGIKEVP